MNLQKEIEDILETIDAEHYDTIKEDLMNGEEDNEDLIQALAKKEISYKLEDSYGGEGQGDDYYAIYSFSRGDEKIYMKFWGWYASHYGAEYEDCCVVTPKQKTITVYE